MVHGTERRLTAFGLAAAALLASTRELGAASLPEEAVAAEIQAAVEDDPAHALLPEAPAIASTLVLPDFYARRRFRPAWSDPADVEALLASVRESANHGLEPRDYHDAALVKLRPLVRRDALHAAAFDLLATDAALRLGHHLRFGKIDPETLDPTWNFDGGSPPESWAAVLQAALDAHRVGEALTEQAPRGWLYENLKRGLAALRRTAEAGGWPPVPSGPTLRPGDDDRRVPTLRARLAASGDLPGGTELASSVYDAALAEAVRRFQKRHGLDDDAALGPRTLAELQVPVSARIGRLRVNLERARWVLRDLPDRFVLVNVAGFEALYFDERKPAWRARVQVGQAARRTPVFRAEMTYLVFNPSWTVPPVIVAEDILSHGAGAPGVVRRKGLTVLDRAGRAVDPESVAWTRYTAHDFPYVLRQEPGPSNALGRVKFMLPNEHLVYLHDTPSKELFERSERAFSSGCIRVERPFELAEILLNDPVSWSRERIDAVVATGKTTTVFLERPVPVLLLYWTAVPTLEGEIRYFRDLYGRDPEVLAGLEEPFAFGSVGGRSAAGRP